MEWHCVWWMTSTCVARVCQHQLSFLFLLRNRMSRGNKCEHWAQNVLVGVTGDHCYSFETWKRPRSLQSSNIVYKCCRHRLDGCVKYRLQTEQYWSGFPHVFVVFRCLFNPERWAKLFPQVSHLFDGCGDTGCCDTRPVVTAQTHTTTRLAFILFVCLLGV